MKLTINSKISVESVGVEESDDYVVYVEEKSYAYVINETAYKVLKVIIDNKEVTIDVLLDTIAELYSIEEEKIKEDVLIIVRLFEERNIIILN